MAPAAYRSLAPSWTASRILERFFTITLHLRYCTCALSFRERRCWHSQQRLSILLQARFLFVVNIGALIFCESVQKEPAVPVIHCNDGAEPAALSLTGPR